MSDYSVEILLKMKSDGLEQAALVNAALASLETESKKTNATLDEMRQHSRDSRSELQAMGFDLQELGRNSSSSEGHLSNMRNELQRVTTYTRAVSIEIANLGLKLDQDLTPAFDRTTRSAGSSGAAGGLWAFVQGAIPGQRTAGNITIAVAAAAAAFAPFTAELLASLTLLGAWVVGGTAFIATITLALGPLLALSAAFVALGIAQTGGLDAHQTYLDLQKQLKTATNSNESAQEALAKAQLAVNQATAVAPNQQAAVVTAQRGVEAATLSVTQAKEREAQATLLVQQAQERANAAVAKYGAGSSQATTASQALERAQFALQTAHEGVTRAALSLQGAQDGVTRAQNTVAASGQASATQLLTLKQAQEQAAESAKAQADLQVKVNKAYVDSQRPLSLFREGLSALGKEFGERAIPYVDKFGTLLLGFLPTIKDVGNQLFTFFGSNFDFVLKVAHDAIVGVVGAFEILGAAEAKVINHVKENWPTFGPILGGAFDFLVKGAVGLLENLVKLSDWFVQRLPVLGPNAKSTFDNIGIAVQGVGHFLGAVVDWVILHWPGINAVFNASWNEFKAGWSAVQPFFLALRKELDQLGPIFKFIADNGSNLLPVMWGLAGVIVVVLGTISLFVIAGILLVAGVIQLVIWFKEFVGWVIQLRKFFDELGKAAHLIVTTAWPELKKTGEELGKAFDTLGQTILGIIGHHDQLRVKAGDVVGAEKDLGKGVDDTRDAFTRFMTSGGVIGVSTFLAVTLPHHLLTAAAYFNVLADAVSVGMVNIETLVKVASDVIRGDFIQAGKDMVAGAEKSGGLLKTEYEDTKTALTLTQQTMDGTLVEREKTFRETMLGLFATTTAGQISSARQAKEEILQTQEEMHLTSEQRTAAYQERMAHLSATITSGQISDARQAKEETLQRMREMHQESVGASIIPDMVNSILAWFELMRKNSVISADQMSLAIQGATNLLSKFMNTGWAGIFTTVTGWASLLSRTLQSTWDGMVGSGGAAMSQLGTKVHEGVRGAAQVLENFIQAIDVALNPILGHDPIPHIDVNKLESGGVMEAGSGGGKVTKPTAIVGEGGGPEYVIPVEPKYHQRAVNLWAQAGKDLQMMAQGGAINQGNPYDPNQCTGYVWSRFPGMPVDGNAGDWWANLSGLQHVSTPAPGEIVVYGAGGGYSQYGHVAVVESFMQGNQFLVSEANYKGYGITDQRWSSMADVLGFLNPAVRQQGSPAGNLIGAAIDVLGPMVDGALKQAQALLSGVPAWIRDLPANVLTQLSDATKAKLASIFGGTGVSGAIGSPTAPGGDLALWILDALAITHTPTSWSAGLRTLIGRESSGNPAAINLTDVNARAGTPSQGLMQLIPSNFNKYHVAGTSGSITDPVANIAAGIEYIKARYGDIFHVQQANPNLPPKGYDAGGLLMPGLTMAVNQTGRPETVTPAASMDRVENLLKSIDARLATLAGQARPNAQSSAGRFAGGIA